MDNLTVTTYPIGVEMSLNFLLMGANFAGEETRINFEVGADSLKTVRAMGIIVNYHDDTDVIEVTGGRDYGRFFHHWEEGFIIVLANSDGTFLKSYACQTIETPNANRFVTKAHSVGIPRVEVISAKVAGVRTVLFRNKALFPELAAPPSAPTTQVAREENVGVDGGEPSNTATALREVLNG